MKTKINLTFLTLLFTLLISSNLSAQTAPITKKADAGKVEVYYFHMSIRCATCRAVEAEAKRDVKELFGDTVSFAAYNLDEKAGKTKGKELGVNSQALLIVKGKKIINITNEGFMYARTNPQKLKKIIEDKVKPLL